MRIMHEAVAQLDGAMLRLMSTMLATTSSRFDADGVPAAEGHVGKIMLCSFLRAWRCWRPQGCCQTFRS